MATKNATTRAETNEFVGVFRLVKFGIAALLAVSIVNVLVLFIGVAMVDFPAEFVGGPFGPLAVGPVVINSAVAALGATLVYGVVTRYAARPNRTFTVIAGAILILSFAMFLAPDLAGAPPRVFATLAVMHVTAAVTIVGVLTRATTQKEMSR
ncbi:DUF6069 family protein [Haloprofundus salinisoli]|uniref:DUF6069 family protein n=1 Tax=Haloprofundus salinisoli TaxID=2876193 RepID=UPI001CCC6661|nr:DUF6069 family protein [Haloprofundus salinisoli]